MQIDWDVPIEMDDGLVLRADVFRPDGEGSHPVILSYGPYAKGLAFQEGYPNQWERMVSQHPDVEAGSSNRYQSWELVDPEKWVPDGYVCVRVDSRGAGRSPGMLDPFSPRETSDLAACIEWAASRPWSSGKVGLNGISYWQIMEETPRRLFRLPTPVPNASLGTTGRVPLDQSSAPRIRSRCLRAPPRLAVHISRRRTRWPQEP